MWGKFCIFFAFGFIKENCLIKLSWLEMDIMSYMSETRSNKETVI